MGVGLTSAAVREPKADPRQNVYPGDIYVSSAQADVSGAALASDLGACTGGPTGFSTLSRAFLSRAQVVMATRQSRLTSPAGSGLAPSPPSSSRRSVRSGHKVSKVLRFCQAGHCIPPRLDRTNRALPRSSLAANRTPMGVPGSTQGPPWVPGQRRRDDPQAKAGRPACGERLANPTPASSSPSRR